MRRPASTWLVLLLLMPALALPSIIESTYYMSIAVTAAAFCVLSVCLNLIYGYVGLLSLCQVAFWGLGAYATAILTAHHDVSIGLALIASGIVAVLASILVGIASFRVSRHSFAIASLVFALLLQHLAYDWTSLTRGAMGIPGLPVPELAIPLVGRVAFGRAHDFFYLMCAWAIVTILFVRMIILSRVGRALVAIRENTSLAESHGLNVFRYKLIAFAISSFFTGVAGGLFCLFISIADPSVFDFYYTEAMLVMVILGGAGTFWPVIVASIVFTFAPEFLRIGEELRLVLYGALLVAAMLAMPEGFAGFVKMRRRKRQRTEFSEALAGKS
ncbi:MAG: branched-chain amino acid ABC transporter permease [Albidovulum sp.]|nr:branched-chain amino acid ABC transporter permease [Albidovulum sp.]MDE0531815.1 branched-chain amino acid ABC transporter permease [Albidovulum sp.]